MVVLTLLLWDRLRSFQKVLEELQTEDRSKCEMVTAEKRKPSSSTPVSVV